MIDALACLKGVRSLVIDGASSWRATLQACQTSTRCIFTETIAASACGRSTDRGSGDLLMLNSSISCAAMRRQTGMNRNRPPTCGEFSGAQRKLAYIGNGILGGANRGEALFIEPPRQGGKVLLEENLAHSRGAESRQRLFWPDAITSSEIHILLLLEILGTVGGCLIRHDAH
jgi:hypothetical protein